MFDIFLMPRIHTRLEMMAKRMIMIVPITPTTAPKSKALALKWPTSVSVNVKSCYYDRIIVFTYTS